MKNKYLPIGSVVMLDGGTHAVMVTGYCAETAAFEGRTFDYRGCPFPEGVIEDKGVALFDNNMIQKVLHTGWECDESIDFLDKLEIIIDEHKN